MAEQNTTSLLIQADKAARAARSAVLRTQLTEEQVTKLQRLLDNPVLLGLLELRIKGYTSLNRSRLLALHRFISTAPYTFTLSSGQTVPAEAIRLTPSGWLIASKHLPDCAEAMSTYRCYDGTQGICATAERISIAVRSKDGAFLNHLVFWNNASRQIPEDCFAKPKRKARGPIRVEESPGVAPGECSPADCKVLDRVHPFAEILVQEG